MWESGFLCLGESMDDASLYVQFWEHYSRVEWPYPMAVYSVALRCLAEDAIMRALVGLDR